MLNKDPIAKELSGYMDPKSFVRNDGSEVLFGEDWTRRKKELWVRCQGRCEYLIPLPGGGVERCRRMADDPHHTVPRSKGRDDRLSKLQALCRHHHLKLDRRQVQWTRKV